MLPNFGVTEAHAPDIYVSPTLHTGAQATHVQDSKRHTLFLPDRSRETECVLCHTSINSDINTVLQIRAFLMKLLWESHWLLKLKIQA